jgi:hypothetical protein
VNPIVDLVQEQHPTFGVNKSESEEPVHPVTQALERKGMRRTLDADKRHARWVDFAGDKGNAFYIRHDQL